MEERVCPQVVVACERARDRAPDAIVESARYDRATRSQFVPLRDEEGSVRPPSQRRQTRQTRECRQERRAASASSLSFLDDERPPNAPPRRAPLRTTVTPLSQAVFTLVVVAVFVALPALLYLFVRVR
jgi:hypothetical protein